MDAGLLTDASFSLDMRAAVSIAPIRVKRQWSTLLCGPNGPDAYEDQTHDSERGLSIKCHIGLIERLGLVNQSGHGRVETRLWYVLRQRLPDWFLCTAAMAAKVTSIIPSYARFAVVLRIW